MLLDLTFDINNIRVECEVEITEDEVVLAAPNDYESNHRRGNAGESVVAFVFRLTA